MNILQELSQCVARRIVLDGRAADTSAQAFHCGFGINAVFARPLGVLITSLCENNRPLALSFHILTLPLAEDEIARFRAIAQGYQVNICIYVIAPAFFTGLPTKAHWPLPTYFRFILPTLVDARTVLYLDSDLLCLESIQSLLTTPLGEHIVAAVPDVDSTAISRRAALQTSAYFNAGVLLIDIANWNRARISERALTMLFATPEKFALLDQDVLNVLLDGQTKLMDREWNHILEFHYSVNRPVNADGPAEALRHARLLHLTGAPKPWSLAYACPSVQQRYLDYEQRSPWADTPLHPPRTHRERRYYTEKLWQERRYGASIAWYLRYLRYKLFARS